MTFSGRAFDPVVRRFFRDSLLYAIPGAVSTGTSIVTFPLFAHHFEPGAYGVLDIITFTGTLAVLIVALEIDQGVGRYTAGEKDDVLVRRYASTALWWTIACYLDLRRRRRPAGAPDCSGSAREPAIRGDRTSGGWLDCVARRPQCHAGATAVQLRPRAFGSAAVVNALLTAGGSFSSCSLRTSAWSV